jgi:hypothetical protein
MTKQIERIVNLETGETRERELTQAEIDENANANPFGSNE